MELGHIIKIERRKQNMKQMVLAKGICTPSYLSRIERGLIEADEEIIRLLIGKLGLDYNAFTVKSISEQEILEKKLFDTYRKAVVSKNATIVHQSIEHLEKLGTLYTPLSLHFPYLLILLRLRLIESVDLMERKKELELLSNFSEEFSLSNKYFFMLNSAIYHYHSKNIKKSSSYFEKTLEMTEHLRLCEWELNELLYMAALAFAADNQINKSTNLVSKALIYFKDNFLMERVLECYILLGVCYKKTLQYKEAHRTYLKAKDLCLKFNIDKGIGIILHNLGSLNIVMGNKEEGIKYFHRSLDCKDDDRSKLITIFALIIEYSKAQNRRLVTEWCEIGLSVVLELSDYNLTPFYHHFNFYKFLYKKSDMFHKVGIDAINYFEEIEDYKHSHKYSIALSQHFRNQNKYKLATTYFQKGIEYHYKNQYITTWEEL